ncbi:hypothetical protein BDM02DRAFT_3119483 [Thelephora ganbajun]|uniref:Uncharacterized protein n=1 Tax=Thelephora ganbajun TaxID=370292 RepID=A0ACB6Z8M7_THEGA|nr:hypothetical protein BDM02DRAFT_3119483 [Thelephora ganbajun]
MQPLKRGKPEEQTQGSFGIVCVTKDRPITTSLDHDHRMANFQKTSKSVNRNLQDNGKLFHRKSPLALTRFTAEQSGIPPPRNPDRKRVTATSKVVSKRERGYEIGVLGAFQTKMIDTPRHTCARTSRPGKSKRKPHRPQILSSTTARNPRGNDAIGDGKLRWLDGYREDPNPQQTRADGCQKPRYIRMRDPVRVVIRLCGNPPSTLRSPSLKREPKVAKFGPHVPYGYSLKRVQQRNTWLLCASSARNRREKTS